METPNGRLRLFFLIVSTTAVAVVMRTRMSQREGWTAAPVMGVAAGSPGVGVADGRDCHDQGEGRYRGPMHGGQGQCGEREGDAAGQERGEQSLVGGSAIGQD